MLNVASAASLLEFLNFPIADGFPNKIIADRWSIPGKRLSCITMVSPTPPSNLLYDPSSSISPILLGSWGRWASLYSSVFKYLVCSGCDKHFERLNYLLDVYICRKVSLKLKNKVHFLSY